ncbi:MAG: folate-binding protein [Roseiarcus sp.]|jgi:folate-binding protein YgfZ
MTKKAAFLDDRGVVRVSGEDATGFLQGLLTNDVERLGPHEARYAALLSPQGKILFDFLVVRAPADAGAAFLVDCAAAQAGDLVRRLGFYRLRARIALADESADHGIIAYWNAEPENAPGGVFYADPRVGALGHRAILPRAKAVAISEASAGEYEALRISLGVPKGGVDFAYGEAFPHDADMDLFNGLDFEKGCYVGQEVVSRMKHRGEARKRVVRVRLIGAAPAPGAAVTDGELPVGVIGSSSGRHALALLRLDRVEEAKAGGRTLSAAGVGVVVAGGEAFGRP